MPDVPRPILSRDDQPIEPEEERSSTEHENHARHSEEVRIHARLCKNAGNCRVMSIPIRAWHIHTTVGSELRQRARETRLIVIELKDQSSERWISMRKKWNKWIMQGERHWNRVVSIREAKRAREEPAQDLSGEIPIPRSSGVKRTYSESTALPNLPGITSGSGVKRACNEYCVAESSGCLVG